MIFIRALWGDNTVCTYQKALLDIQERSGRLDCEYPLYCVAYGEHNAAFLRKRGYDNIITRAEQLPIQYAANLDRPRPVSKRRPGTVVDGVMMWWHKLDAIRVVMHGSGASDAIWLDWDTKILKTPDEAMWRMLREGPAFQGAECPWKSSRAPWRTGNKWAFHGGCYYVRGVELIEQAIVKHATQWPLYSDETVMTDIADHVIGQDCENLSFYRCRKVKPGTPDSTPYFREGDVFHWKDKR